MPIIVALLAYTVGVWARVAYGLYQHHPRHTVVSDAANMMRTSDRMLQMSPQRLADTIWPPGMAGFTALFRSIDPTLELATTLQVVAACAVPWIVAHTAYLLYGRKPAIFAFIAASLHFGYIHYVGFFLSESLFQFTTAVAIWTTIATTTQLDNAPGTHRTTTRIGYGFAVGLTWASATLFRPNTLPIALVLCLALALFWRSPTTRRNRWALVGAALGMLCVLGPASHRCTTIKGDFCPVSSNAAMNIALGQAGEVSALTFQGETRQQTSTWVPPSLGRLGYQQPDTVPASIYDSRAVLAWTYTRVAEAPGKAIVRALGNALDLFGYDYWPSDTVAWGKRAKMVASQLFWLVVVVPGLVGFARGVPPIWRNKATSSEVVTTALLVAVLLSSALTMGAPRYRVPFDPLLIALAGSVWFSVPSRETSVMPSQNPWLQRGIVGIAVCTGFFATTVLVISHPEGFGIQALTGKTHAIVGRRVVRRHARRLEAPLPDGTPWDVGTVLHCTPACPELRVIWPKNQRGGEVSLSLDHNDRYQVQFYRDERVVHIVSPPWSLNGNGLKTVYVDAPQGGFDSVGVIPLWGDGHYSVGQVRASRPRPQNTQKKVFAFAPTGLSSGLTEPLVGE